MDKNIIVLGIVFIILFIILRCTYNEKDGFFDFPDGSDKAFIEDAQKKFAGISNMINVADSAVNVKSGGANSTVKTLYANATPRAYTLNPVVPEKSIEAIPATIAMGKSCEAGGSTCAAFDDPTFAANCGMSFDMNGTGTDGKPHIGGMYISPDDRLDQEAAAQNILDTGEPPYDPYQLYQPTLGSAARGTFGITKEGCTVVKEKVDCLTNQTFDVKNCTQCYTSGSFARVGPETGRLPAIIFLAGKGRVVVEGLVTGNHDLSTNAIQMDLPGDAEGKNFRIKLSGDAPIYVSGYIRGTTPTGTFKLDIFNLVQSDLVTNAKARITGTMSINEFTCVTMMPGTGQSTATFSCLVPFSFLNMYDGDAMTCDNGPIITKASSATFLESDPCFGKANKPGAYKLECLQSRWLQIGGTAEGTGYPNDQTKADALQRDANGNPLTINQIINNLVVIMKRARTGKNDNVNLSIPEWNTASMFMLGIPINTPCDGPGGVPPLSQQCQEFLYANKGLGTRIGSTYTLPSSYSHTKEAFSDVVQMYNYPGTSIDPDYGYNANGGIPDVKNTFNQTNQVANDNSKSNAQRSAAVQQAYGVTLAPRTPGKDDFDVRVPANQNTKSYADMKSVCEAKGLRLCESSEICDMSSRQVIQPELPNSFPGDNWIAVGDKDNEWLTLNNWNNRYCRTHSEVTQNEGGSAWLPSWGSQRDPGGWERLAKCCGGDYLNGATREQAAESAVAIKKLTGTNTNGAYWINLPTAGPTLIPCIMDSAVNGGGWMMAMKATYGTTFYYDSPYWTQPTTLNDSDTTRNNGDAKFHTMNYYPSKDIMAIWPDIPYNHAGGSGGTITLPNYGWCWLKNDYYGGGKQTLLSVFKTASDYSFGEAKGAERGTAFSSQGGARWYGINFAGRGYWWSRVRWGFAWNNENDWWTNDVSGGLGLDARYGNHSAADVVNCCQDYTGINRRARVEMYVR